MPDQKRTTEQPLPKSVEAHRRAVAEQDRRWREQGQAEQGGHRDGWNL